MNTGAMVYSAGSYDCSDFDAALDGWAFESPTTSTRISACDMTRRLETLADNIAQWDLEHGLPSQNSLYFGPNDCMINFPVTMIAQAAAALANVVSTASAASGGVHLFAEVDAEGYSAPDCANSDTLPEHCTTTDATFFADYHAGGSTIGSAGGGSCSDDAEAALSAQGGGAAIPQVYTYFYARSSSCSIDPLYDDLPGQPGAWPATPIASGYAGIQAYPSGSTQTWPNGATAPFYSPRDANIRWSRCHSFAPPAVDFDWSAPGGAG
jgi:hypothetical protein